jgi:hypothetical protein
MADADVTPAAIADQAWQAHGVGTRPPRNGAALSEGLPIKFWRDLDAVAPPDRLVRRLLGTATLALIYGEPGSGKTFLATDLAMHIALGRSWFGRSVTPGAVVYVACEGAAGISNRLAAFRRRLKLPDEVPIAVIPAAVNLGPGGHDADRIIEAVASVQLRTGQMVQLVVLDTLARAMGTGDENSTQDMGLFITACDRIRIATGCTVAIVHHRGKAQQSGARGSSALLGAVDTAIEVEKRDAGRVARVAKQKDGADGEELGFSLEVIEIGTDDEGEPITTCIVAPADRVAKRVAKLSPTERRAVDVLLNVLADHPVAKENFRDSLGNSVTYPNVTMTKIDAFRSGLKLAGVTDRDSPQNERQQWHRITTNLCNKGVLVISGDLCWKA